MKKILAVILSLVIVCAVLVGIAGVTATNLFAAGRLRGSGHLVTKRIEAPDFAAIDASRAVKVIVTDALTDEIVIEADDNVMEKVQVESRRGTLFVGIDKSVRRISDYSVTVRVPANGQIRALDASSAATIVCETVLEAYEFLIDVSSAAEIDVALKATQCRIDVSSAGELVAALEADSCTADLSSAAKAKLSGRSRWCEVDVSSAAKYDAGRMVVAHCLVDASSGASADVHCTDTLRASASSGADISYSGECKVEAQHSSGGSVHSINR